MPMDIYSFMLDSAWRRVASSRAAKISPVRLAEALEVAVEVGVEKRAERLLERSVARS